MEINAEINRVFGKEMANIFASTITEEEMMRTAIMIWDEMNTPKGLYNNNSDFKEHVKQVFKNNLSKKIEEITSTDEFKEQISAMAKDIVDEIIVETRKKMIQSVSDNLSRLAGTINTVLIHDGGNY